MGNIKIKKELRNKKIAHYDLNSAYKDSPQPILFSKIEELVIDTSELLTITGKLIFGDIPPITYEEAIQIYKDELLKI